MPLLNLGSYIGKTTDCVDYSESLLEFSLLCAICGQILKEPV